MVVTVGFLRRLCENRNIFPCFHSFSYHCAAVVLLAMKMSKHAGPSAYNAGYSETMAQPSHGALHHGTHHHRGTMAFILRPEYPVPVFLFLFVPILTLLSKYPFLMSSSSLESCQGRQPLLAVFC